MTDRRSRRDFLHAAVLGSAGLAASASLSSFTAPLAAIEPITRPAGHHFKYSLAAYSYRDLLKQPQPKLTLLDFIEDCAKFNLDGTELTSYYFPDPVTPEFLRSLKAETFRRGLDISGTAIGNDFCLPAGPERDKQIALVKRWIEYADQMDAPVIRVFSGKARPGQEPAQAVELALTGMEECCAYAGKFGVILALENHGGLTATPAGMLDLVKQVRSPWFAVNLDSGNFHGPDVYAELEQIAPYAVNVQIKVAVKPQGQDKQASDLPRLAAMLKKVGYRGYVVLEFEEPGDPRAESQQWVEKLKAAFA